MEPAPEAASPAPRPDLPTPPDAPACSESPTPSTQSRPVSAVVPPFWQRHERNESYASQNSLVPAITLEDHAADPECETSRGLWARSVSIADHCVVQGKTGVGAYVVWNCTVHTLDVSSSFKLVLSACDVWSMRIWICAWSESKS
jgi:hypothetical protein